MDDVNRREVTTPGSQAVRPQIMVLHSSPELRRLLQDLFEDERYDVTTSDFELEGIEKIVAVQPSLLIVNIAVGETAAWNFLQHVRSSISLQKPPLLIMSTLPASLEYAKTVCGEREGVRYLIEPFELEELLDAVRALIGSA